MRHTSATSIDAQDYLDMNTMFRRDDSGDSGHSGPNKSRSSSETSVVEKEVVEAGKTSIDDDDCAFDEQSSSLRPDAPEFQSVSSFASYASRGSFYGFRNEFENPISGLSSISNSCTTTPLGSPIRQRHALFNAESSFSSPTHYREPLLPSAYHTKTSSSSLGGLFTPEYASAKAPKAALKDSQGHIRSAEGMVNPQLVMVPGVGLRIVDCAVGSSMSSPGVVTSFPKSPARPNVSLPSTVSPMKKNPFVLESADGYIYTVSVFIRINPGIYCS